MGSLVKYEVTDGIAVIKLNRPDNLNAFTSGLRSDLAQALNDVANDDSVRAVVLTGEGRCFSAGADLKDISAGQTVTEQLQYEYRPVFAAIAGLPVPVIAAVPGSAAGIGMSLALQCDLVIMADDAFLLSPFSTISLVPDGGLNWMLVRHIGYKRAFQLSIEADRIDAARCVELGLANKTAAADELPWPWPQRRKSCATQWTTIGIALMTLRLNCRMNYSAAPTIKKAFPRSCKNANPNLEASSDGSKYI
jgi:2-(1,2-epoxy-1,2-dihydrophenyl)acetyl-CoA isomerase